MTASKENTPLSARFDKDGYIEIPPVAGGLSETLRAAGYEFVDAMADLVDNSIDAGATEVYVNIDLDTYLEPRVFIADNGCGMSRVEIARALTYGSEDSADTDRLGKFGIGLKTASTAFCRKILILTRDELGSCWRGVLDLDDIKNTARWRCRVTELNNAQERALLDNYTGRGSGTLVWWHEIDHLFDKDVVRDEAVRNRKIRAYAKKFSEHAARTFHRFIDKQDDRARNVEIYVNGDKLRANNPICEFEESVDIFPTTTHNVRDERGEVIGTYSFRIALLPNREDFSSEEAYKRASITMANQGIYVYRENRIIAHQGWMGIREPHPSGNYIRAALDMDHNLDDVLKIDYKKDSVTAREGFTKPFEDAVITAFSRAQVKADEVKKEKSDKEFFSPATGTTHAAEAKKKAAGKKTSAPVKMARRSDVWVSAGKTVGGGAALWAAAREKDATALYLNHEHPFYQVVSSGKVSPEEVLDTVLWALGNEESKLVAGTSAAKMMHIIADSMSSQLRSIAESWDDNTDSE